MRNIFLHPGVRFAVAHILVCYLWVGAIVLYSVLTRPEPTPTIEPGFHDANGDGYDDADEPDEDPWYLRGSVIAISAPVSIPCLLVMAVFLTVASPVEHLPVPACLILLTLYFIPLGLAYLLFGWRRRPRVNQPLQWTSPAERSL
jgi:hypothetical protein